jgi:HlyD family secretion protein
VQPINKVDVSSELSGTVRKVLVDYNSVVVAGQTLAELDTDKLIATVESSRARLAAAKARVRDAEATVVEKEKDLARKKTLASKQISSAHDLDTAQAAYDRALASVASTRADALLWAERAKAALANVPADPIRDMLADLADYVVARIT